MTQPTNTPTFEYCEVCGTMLLLGRCRRCNPEPTKEIVGRTKSIRVHSTATKNVSQSNKQDTHRLGVDYVANKLTSAKITYTKSDIRGIDFELNDTTILVRAMSKHGRVPLINGTLDILKADYLIIVTDLTTNPKMYGMSMIKAKNQCENTPYRENGRADFFITPETYTQYSTIC